MKVDRKIPQRLVEGIPFAEHADDVGVLGVFVDFKYLQHLGRFGSREVRGDHEQEAAGRDSQQDPKGDFLFSFHGFIIRAFFSGAESAGKKAVIHIGNKAAFVLE